MTFTREFGLIHNPDTSERFVRLVKWEGRWSAPDEAGYEAYTASPTVWEYAMLDVANPRTLTYDGPVFKPVPVVITALPLHRWPVGAPWPREAPSETEEMRRMRIRALRRVCHVDEALGLAEPDWRVAA